MKTLTNDQFDDLIRDLYFSWSKEYRAAFRKKRPRGMYGYRIKLTDQLEYVQMDLGHLMLDGKTRESLVRIKKFLDLQKINLKSALEIHFVGGSPYDVIVHVNHLKEIDFSDTHGLVGYDSIHIMRRDKRWTQKNADKIFQDIKYDLKFDGSNFEPASIDITNGDEISGLSFTECNID